MMDAKSKAVFVTVGSTKFDDLARAVLSSEVLDALRTRGFSELVFQCGNSDMTGLVPQSSTEVEWNWTDGKTGMEISVWRFKPELAKSFEQASLVISHAGSGTILEVLRLPRPMIVVPNETLLDNHQVELANALEGLGHLFTSTPSTLVNTIQTYDATRLKEFPQFDGSKFRAIMDEEMGFI
ncbi:N-acetylglucosaminyldiphosphodolichol N-acetylglucosaminyltransferase catalytic subunit alg13 [Ceratobasidium sp. 394]|nr:N-acetylglucosaminyldiphosphodolichol N-acetylglucosaminyltransferase catalytic subunit alg13 [Ceratobasidium sp. 394]KAG9095165.1 N-acetylglucosaminyldiphosphodolichol N-acetylglucosaminyltransferase catalytic subunit alg13 [Ceratobasidium sp. UAMH 11750]